mgnify:CR=1 FL=1
MPNKNSWLYFLREFRKKNPKLKGASVMKQAAKVYKKQPKKPKTKRRNT